MAKVLIVDDERSMLEVLELTFTQVGHEVTTASSHEEAAAELSKGTVELVLTDFQLRVKTGLDVLRSAQRSSSAPEVIIITAYGTPESAVAAMRQGAYDYISKPFDNEELMLLAERALEKRRLKLENVSLRESGPVRPLIGDSAAMRGVWALIEKVAPTRATVLITGESGTGKEVVARAIHRLSSRGAAPFLPVNCGALTEGLLESELFGHMKGSFTGASSDHVGLLIAARDGTVLLDEIGELSLNTQVKLLRVLQERKVRPVGGTSEVPFQARVLAATNRDLEADVRAERFREDLLFRLNALTIDLPPLREHREDIPLLAQHFLAKAATELERPRLRFLEETLRLLTKFQFSGNVRQLQNIVERAATLSDTDDLGPDSLPAALRGEEEQEPTATFELPEGFLLEKHLDALEHRYLLEALKRAGGVKMRAAELLGLTFRSFRYRLAKHGLGEREERSSKF